MKSEIITVSPLFVVEVCCIESFRVVRRDISVELYSTFIICSYYEEVEGKQREQEE